MAKKITQEEIIDKNIWENTIKSTKELINQVDILQDELKKVAETSAKIVKESNKPTFESLKQADEEVNKLNKAFEGKILLDKERLKLEKQLATAKAKQSQQNKDLLRDLANEKEALRKNNLENRQIARVKNTQIGTIENLRARLALVTNAWTKLTAVEIENTKRGQRLNESKKQLTAQLKKLESATGDNRREVGNYGKGLEGLKNKFRSLAGTLGIGLGIQALRTFSSELVELNNQSKGINFAFDRLGDRGVDAFNRVKASTKGLLSDLDIKRSLVEFDNFNLSLEQSDVLFEFLSVRATQTGKSVDKLKESLVEGLSKESKLRIDNLGISTQDLNEELERTPNFIDAVANIAKREVKEAGDILTDAGSSQERWNVRIKNTKELLAKQLQPVFETVFEAGATGLKFISDNLNVILKSLKALIKGFLTYKIVVNTITIAQKAYTLAVNLSTKGMIAFNKATKANFIGVLVTALVLAYDALKDYTSQLSVAETLQKSLNDVNKVALKNTVSQKSELEALLLVARNENLSKEKRKEAIEEINKISPEYLNNITLETINTEEATKAIGDYIKELDKQSVAKARIARIDKINQELQTEQLKEGKDFIKDASLLDRAIQGATTTLFTTRAEQEKKLIEAGVKASFERVQLLEAEKKALQDLYAEGLETETEFVEKSVDLNKKEYKAKKKTVDEYQEYLKRIRKEDIELEEQEFKDSLAREKERQRIIDEAENAVMPEEEEEEAPLIDEEYEKQRQLAIDQAEFEKSLREKTLATLSALNDKFFNDKKTKLDNEITEAKEREKTLEQLANQGNKQASESLASNQKEQAEANAKKEELLKKEKAFETALAIINSFNAGLDSGKSNSEALAEAVTSVSVLTSLASSLPSFYEGTENTGTVSNPLDSNGGRVSILHNNERVLTEKQNKLIGDYSNEDVANTMYKFNNGLLTDVTDLNTPHINLQQTRFESNEAILNKFDNLEKSIVSAINDKETYLGSDVDTIKRVINQHYKKNGTKTTIKTKSKLW